LFFSPLLLLLFLKFYHQMYFPPPFLRLYLYTHPWTFFSRPSLFSLFVFFFFRFFWTSQDASKTNHLSPPYKNLRPVPRATHRSFFLKLLPKPKKPPPRKCTSLIAIEASVGLSPHYPQCKCCAVWCHVNTVCDCYFLSFFSFLHL